MNRIYLSASEKQRLEYLYKHTIDSYVSDRIKAILLSYEGRSLVDIAIYTWQLEMRVFSK